MKIRSAIVTGANGFIGSALTKRLLDDGAEVWAIVRNAESMTEFADNNKLHIVIAAFDDYEILSKKIAGRGFDVFFHLAWSGYGTATNDYKVQLNNVLYSCAAANSAVQLEVKRFIFADSFHEFMISQNSLGNKGICTIYGTAKFCAQNICKTVAHNADIDFLGVMFANVFGEGDKSSRSVNTFIRKLLDGEDLNLVDGGRLHDWIYIEDCVSAVIAAACQGKAGKVYYIGNEPKRFDDVVMDIRDVINPKSVLNFGVYPDDTYIDFDKIDIKALQRDTGFVCKADFKESIVKTAKWLQKYTQK